MELIIRYLQEKLKILSVILLFFLVFGVVFYLYKLPIEAVVYPCIVCVFLGVIFLLFDFAAYRNKYNTLNHLKISVYNLADKFPTITSMEDREYQDIIAMVMDFGKRQEMDMVSKYHEMVEYYSVWAHQIKTPIASMRLSLQSEDSPLSRKLTNDLFRIEQYVDMVMLFLRVKSDSTDYRIEKVDMDKIIKNGIKGFSTEFITKNISIDYISVDKKVVTDEKWMLFVIEQILSNSLKYSTKGKITISIRDDLLTIKDEGIGISKEDLPRVFEYGYTGYPGRLDKKASGIGLYLCKTICDRLGHKIDIRSEVGKGTTVTVDLSRYELEIE